jgi:hypothetical protein
MNVLIEAQFTVKKNSHKSRHTSKARVGKNPQDLTPCVHVQVQVIATDGQSASSSLCSAPFGASDQIFYFFDWQLLLSFSCREPSLTRGRVCNLKCNVASSSSSYIATDGQSASTSLCHAPFGASDQIFYFFEWQLLLSFSCREPSLTSGGLY